MSVLYRRLLLSAMFKLSQVSSGTPYISYAIAPATAVPYAPRVPRSALQLFDLACPLGDKCTLCISRQLRACQLHIASPRNMQASRNKKNNKTHQSGQRKRNTS